MIEKDWLQLALCQFNTTIPQWYGWKETSMNKTEMTYNDVKAIDDNAIMPTESEVNAKIEELKQEEIDREARKASAKAKLEALGLTTEEIKEAFGI